MRRGCLLCHMVPFVVLFVVLPVNSWAFIDWARVIGVDASANGRGGTIIAIGDDPSGMEVNPALISETESNALETNLMVIAPDMDFNYTGTDGKRYTSTDKDRFLIAPGMSFAHNVKDSQWHWGLSFAAPDALATDYTINSKNFGSVNASSELLHLRFGPAAAYQITPELSIGTRLNVDYGTLDLKIPLGAAFMDIGQCDGLGVSGAVGLFYKPRKDLSFGVYYESPTAMQDLESKNSDGYIKVMAPNGQVVPFSNLDVKVDSLQFPQNFGVGVAYSPLPALRLSADIKYINWNSDWDDLTIKFSGGDAVAMENAGMPTTLKVPLHIANQWPLALGAEYFIDEIYKVSLGYHYNDDAMSDNYLNPYIPADVQHTLTCGFSVKPVKTVNISMAYMYSFIDDPNSNAIHAYDASLEKQLGMPPGSLQSELSDAKTNYNCQNIQISVSIYW